MTIALTDPKMIRTIALALADQVEMEIDMVEPSTLVDRDRMTEVIGLIDALALFDQKTANAYLKGIIDNYQALIIELEEKYRHG